MSSPGSGREITFSQALHEAQVSCMGRDEGVLVMGLGVTDLKGVFGTTLGLVDAFGPDRVFDMPVSENAMTGVLIGAAISGMRPVMVHQRADFTLMSMDQIINNAAKWHYMYGGRRSVPLTIRMIIGRGWGQGPQHSQNFQAFFAHTPGLKVVAPTTPFEAKGLLTAAIEDDNPVVVIEHRWLYNQLGTVPDGHLTLPIGKADLLRHGSDVTVVAAMDMALEALIVAGKLEKEGVSVEVLNLRTIKPLDEEAILESVERTGRVLVLDSSWVEFGVSAQVAALVAEKGFHDLKSPVRRLGLPDVPTPTTPALANLYYVSESQIAGALEDLLGVTFDHEKLGLSRDVRDVPDEYFKGPF